MSNEHKVFGAVLATVRLCHSSAALILTHTMRALHCRCCHTMQHQQLLTETPLPEMETVVLCISVSCFCVCRYMCVGTYDDQSPNFSCHSSDGNFLLLFLCMCVVYACACVCVHLSLPTAQLCLLFSFKNLATPGSQLCTLAVLLLLSFSASGTASLLFFSFPTEPEKVKKTA